MRACVLGVSILGLFGPTLETYYRCPLTGQDRIVIARMGLTISDRTYTNSTSSWVGTNGIPGLVAGQCGWTLSGTVTTPWFGAPRFGETFLPPVPRGLREGWIKIADSTPEEALREYQQRILSAFNANESLESVQLEFPGSGIP